MVGLHSGLHSHEQELPLQTSLTRRASMIGAASMAAANINPAKAQVQPLRIVSPWEITGLDPARSGFIFSRLEIAETLVTADDGGRPTPALAASWSVSDDRLTWRFQLRPGASFHDGAPVTAGHVISALEKARASAGGLLRTVPIAGIEASGGAVVIRTERPFTSLPAFLAHSSAIILAPGSYDANGVVTQIIGSGPYRATLVEAPLRVEAEAFVGWTGAKPKVERVSYLAVSRGETRAIMAEGGQADLVFVLAPETVERLRRNTRLTVEVMPVPRTRAIKLNVARPAFADLRSRQAFSLAINREGIAKALLRSPRSQATQMFPPSLAEWHVPDLPPLTHNPARSKALLAEAGWRAGPDGVLAKDGQPYRVTLRTFSDRPELPPIATAIQAQLREVGIDLQIAIVNSGEIPAGHKDGTLDCALFARNFSLVPDPLGTLLQDFGPTGGDWGAMNWSRPALNAILEKLGSTADVTERASLRGQVSRILQTELPVVPIAWFDYAVAVNRRVAGASIDPLELSYRVSAMRWA